MNAKLLSFPVEAKVFDDRMLGIKVRTALEPGVYHAVLVIGTPVQEEDERKPQIKEDPTWEARMIEPLAQHLDKERKAHVQRALDACGGNRTQAARLLGVDARSVFRILAEDKEE